MTASSSSRIGGGPLQERRDGGSTHHSKRPAHLIGAAAALEGSLLPQPSPTSVLALRAEEGRSFAPVSSQYQSGRRGAAAGVVAGGSSCLHHRGSHHHQNHIPEHTANGSSINGGGGSSSNNGKEASSSSSSSPCPSVSPAAAGGGLTDTVRQRRQRAGAVSGATTVGLGLLVCLGLGLLTLGRRSPWLSLRSLEDGAGGHLGGGDDSGFGGGGTSEAMTRPTSPAPEESASAGSLVREGGSKGRVAPAWSVDHEGEEAARDDLGSAATSAGAAPPPPLPASGGGNGYDYARSTTEVFGAPDPKDRTFTGPFADIRAGLDYGFHRNYLPERQRVQDAIVQRFLDADAEASASTSGSGPLPPGVGFTHEDHSSLAHVERAPEHLIGPDCRVPHGSGHHTPKQWVVFTAGPMGAGKSHCLKWMARRGFFPLDDFVLVRCGCLCVRVCGWEDER